MSYIRPELDAVHASWAAAAPYTRPALDAVDANFSSSGGATAVNPIGFLVTNFGTPVARYEFVRFGTPSGFNAFRAESMGVIAQFGTPSTPTYTANAVFGFRATKFGTPYGWNVFTFGPVDQFGVASGWIAAQFGAPTATVNSAASVSGWQATQFGEAKLVAVGGATTLGALTQFGSPVNAMKVSAAGSHPTSFGTPSCAAGYLVTGFSRTRFGTPRVRTPDALVARGFRGTRLGTPRGRNLSSGYPVVGFNSTGFGTPTATTLFRVSPTSVSTRFGRPTLKRNPIC